MKLNAGSYVKNLLLAVMITIVFTVPSQAQSLSILEWAKVEKPGIKGNVIVTPSEVSRIAVGRTSVIYSIDSENNKVYRSDNGGLTWNDITSGLLDAHAVLPATEIAVTGDNPQNVAVVTNSSTKVYISNDSGSNWFDTQFPVLAPTEEIQCISMSPGYIQGGNLIFDIAVGTAVWGNATTDGQLWVSRLGALVSVWDNQGITVDSGHIGAEVSAVAFSPNYRSEGTILVAASTAADVVATYQNKTWLCIGQRDLLLQQTTWNSIVGYPVAIIDSLSPPPPPADENGDALGVTKIISSITLPTNYSGTDSTTRMVFLSYDRQPSLKDANDDIYRIDDTTVHRLKAAGGSPIDICSISYYGTLAEGALLAGDTNPASAINVQVRQSLNPTVVPPSLPSWQTAGQPPSGPGNAHVSFSSDGTTAYCGTSQHPGAALDESAFSQSVDTGNSWEQVSLIDTQIKLTDIAPAPDSKSIFMATYSQFATEGIWRSAGEPLGNFWGRVLTLNTSSNRLIIRLSLDYANDSTLYVAEVDGNPAEINQLAVSHTRGNTWPISTATGYPYRYLPGPIVDMAVASRDTIYVALPNGQIRKSSNGGIMWQVPVTTGLDTINMITISNNGHIFVGSRDGRLSYSSNEGSNFIELPEPIGGIRSGDVQVITDANYSNNNIVYAATNNSDGGIWRWVLGSSTHWEQVDEQITDQGTGQSVSGLQTGKESTLYALRTEPVDAGHTRGGMDRTLYPAEPNIPKIEFDILNRTLPVGTSFNPVPLFNNTLPHLKISGNAMQNDLWSVYHVFSGALHIDDIIYRFTDNICKSGPSTSDTGNIGCDPASGRNQGFGLNWEQISLSDRHEMQVAKDDLFTKRIGTEPPDNPFYTPLQMTNPAYYINPGRELECGHSYFWRVRTRGAITGEIIRSPWSTVKEFIIRAGLPVTSPSLGPQLLAPDNSCGCSCIVPVCFSWSPSKETTRYRFELSENSDMANPLVVKNVTGTTAYQYDGSLKCNTAYFWRVQAIEPAPSEWSSTFSFKTGVTPLPQLPSKIKVQTQAWVWMVLATGILVLVCLFVLVLRRLS